MSSSDDRYPPGIDGWNLTQLRKHKEDHSIVVKAPTKGGHLRAIKLYWRNNPPGGDGYAAYLRQLSQSSGDSAEEQQEEDEDEEEEDDEEEPTLGGASSSGPASARAPVPEQEEEEEEERQERKEEDDDEDEEPPPLTTPASLGPDPALAPAPAPPAAPEPEEEDQRKKRKKEADAKRGKAETIKWQNIRAREEALDLENPPAPRPWKVIASLSAAGPILKEGDVFETKAHSTMRVRELFESQKKIAVVWKRNRHPKPNWNSYNCACREEKDGVFCMQVDFAYQDSTQVWLCKRIPAPPFCSAGPHSKKKTNYHPEDLVPCMSSLGKYAEITTEAVRKECMDYCQARKMPKKGTDAMVLDLTGAYIQNVVRLTKEQRMGISKEVSTVDLLHRIPAELAALRELGWKTMLEWIPSDEMHRLLVKAARDAHDRKEEDKQQKNRSHNKKPFDPSQIFTFLQAPKNKRKCILCEGEGFLKDPVGKDWECEDCGKTICPFCFHEKEPGHKCTEEGMKTLNEFLLAGLKGKKFVTVYGLAPPQWEQQIDAYRRFSCSDFAHCNEGFSPPTFHTKRKFYTGLLQCNGQIAVRVGGDAMNKQNYIAVVRTVNPEDRYGWDRLNRMTIAAASSIDKDPGGDIQACWVDALDGDKGGNASTEFNHVKKFADVVHRRSALNKSNKTYAAAFDACYECTTKEGIILQKGRMDQTTRARLERGYRDEEQYPAPLRLPPKLSTSNPAESMFNKPLNNIRTMPMQASLMPIAKEIVARYNGNREDMLAEVAKNEKASAEEANEFPPAVTERYKWHREQAVTYNNMSVCLEHQLRGLLHSGYTFGGPLPSEGELIGVVGCHTSNRTYRVDLRLLADKNPGYACECHLCVIKPCADASPCMHAWHLVSHLKISMSKLVHPADTWDGYKAQYAVPELRIPTTAEIAR